MSKAVKRLGIFGLGAFGQLIVRHLSPYFEILVCDPSPQARRFARHHNLRLTDLETVAKCPYIILATPIRTLFDLSHAIAPFVHIAILSAPTPYSGHNRPNGDCTGLKSPSVRFGCDISAP